MNRAWYFRLLLCCLLGHAHRGLAQEFAPAWDSLLTKQFPAAGPGATVLVAQAGQVLYRRAFGQADLERHVAMTPDYRFRLGSLTKQFTACAILKLAEEGKLSVHNELTRYLPDYPTQGHSLTIEQVLTHTAGIPDYTHQPTFTPAFQRQDLTPRQLVTLIEAQPLDFVPGTQFRYSNSGYVLLGYLIEVVSGKSYERYLQDTFFTPLGMTHTGYDHPEQVIPERAAGYQPGAAGYENAAALSMSLPYAAGALLTNADDLLRWYEALRQGRVLRAASVAQAQQPYRLANGSYTAYGYGWELGTLQGSPVVKHVGRINGFLTYVLYLPQQQVFVSLLTNCNPAPDPERTAFLLAAQAIGQPYPQALLPLTVQQQQRYVGIYQADGVGQRKISWEAGQLLLMPRGGDKAPLRAYAPDRFYEPQTLTLLAITRDKQGAIIGFTATSPAGASTWQRTQEPLFNPRPIWVPAATLDRYVGHYQFNPAFVLAVRREGLTLYGEAFGRQVELVPYQAGKFYARTVDLHLLFHPAKTGRITSLTKVQNGEQLAHRLD
jgi:CubicO group peptidase (beta-lactamase class C family)